jgi:hypothetical protein
LNKKLLLSGISVCLLMFSLVLAGCGDGAGGGGGESPNTFKVTAISQTQINQASTHCLVGLFPVETTQSQVLDDVRAIYLNSGTVTYVIAGGIDPQPLESSAPYSISGSLKSKSSGFENDWRGEGEYHIWFCLISGASSVTVYKTNNPVTLTAGGNLSLSAQSDLH